MDRKTLDKNFYNFDFFFDSLKGRKRGRIPFPDQRSYKRGFEVPSATRRVVHVLDSRDSARQESTTEETASVTSQIEE